MNYPPIVYVTLREQARIGLRQNLDTQSGWYDAAVHRIEMRHTAEGVAVYQRQFARDDEGTERETGAPVLATTLPWGIVKQAWYAPGATLEEPKGKAGR